MLAAGRRTGTRKTSGRKVHRLCGGQHTRTGRRGDVIVTLDIRRGRAVDVSNSVETDPVGPSQVCSLPCLKVRGPSAGLVPAWDG